MTADDAGGEASRLDARARVLAQLAKTWPTAWQVTVPAVGAPLAVTRHPLRGELEAFWHGAAATLPYFASRHPVVHWVTVADGSAALQRLVEMLRAWVLPSFAWEETEPFVVPGAARGALPEALLTLSPAGYFRWTSRQDAATQVADALRQMRAVTARRPHHLHVQVPSLLALRQRFTVALLTGDRDAAEQALQSIDHHQLDSATNTQFMRVRLLDAFKDYRVIVQDPGLDALVQMRMPHAVRTAIARAFHAEYLASIEATGDARAAADTYVAQVHPVLGGLLAFCHADDGPAVTRAAAYRAWHTKDTAAAEELLAANDPFVRPLLDEVTHEVPHNEADDATLLRRLEAALVRDDPRALQALGRRILERSGHSARMGVGDAGDVSSVLRASLESRPNPELRDALDAAAREAGEIPARTAPTLPQTWQELLTAVSAHEWESARRFLSLDAGDRPAIDSLSTEELAAAVTMLEELLTGEIFERDLQARSVAAECLPAFVEDFVKEPQFPRRDFTTLYLHLLHLWAAAHRQSLHQPDGQVLLALAEGVLHFTAESQADVAEVLQEWWNARRVSARLPFLLEAIELLVERTNDFGTAQSLWIDSVQFLAQQSRGMSHAERRLWRSLGLRSGFDEVTVAEVLGTEPLTDASDDPLARLSLKKVAIISLQVRQAEQAGADIEERTGADVVIVTERVAGSRTDSALTADVVLLVWSAVKHAVYRAFDGARDRMVYVQGTGAASIVLALDRWAAKQLADTRDTER